MRPRVAPSVRDLVYVRDGFACCLCGATYPLNLHHRRTAGMGGTRRPESHAGANLMVLCGSGSTGCHGWVTENPDLARQRGYVVRQHANPADVPVIVHGVWSWLCDDGTVVPLGVAELAGLDGGAA